MNHYPNPRGPIRIPDVEVTRGKFSLPRKTALLLAAVLFFSGLFLGAIAFGEVLTASIKTEEIR